MSERRTIIENALTKAPLGGVQFLTDAVETALCEWELSQPISPTEIEAAAKELARYVSQTTVDLKAAALVALRAARSARENPT